MIVPVVLHLGPLLAISIGGEWLPALLSASAVAHLLFSLGNRSRVWQTNPIYAAWLAAWMRWHVCTWVFSVLGIIVRCLFPMPVPSRVIGRHGVGVVDVEYEARHEPGKELPGIGRVFYPTIEEPHGNTARYISMDDRHGLTRLFLVIGAPDFLKPYLPAWALSHWASIRIPAKKAATPWLPADGSRLPVVVFSHGLTASRETSTSLALSLASAGAFVLLLEHTDRSSTLARLMDGQCVHYDTSVSALGASPETPAYRTARRAQTVTRIGNVHHALQFLDRLNGDAGLCQGLVKVEGMAEPDASWLLGRFCGRLAVDRLVLGGHSFGGATVLGAAAEMLSRTSDSEGGFGVAVSACFTLDPAVNWVPEALWDAIGYTGRVGDEPNAPPGPAVDRACPLVVGALDSLTIFSEQWAAFNWYQEWAYGQNLRPRTTSAAGRWRVLQIKGCGHQGLCDLAWNLPHWLNKVLRNTLGGSSTDMAAAVNLSVLAFLQDAAILAPGATPLELQSVPHTTRHSSGQVGVVREPAGARQPHRGLSTELKQGST